MLSTVLVSLIGADAELVIAVAVRAERLQRIQEDLESTLFGITHEGSERIIAEHERRIAEIEALRAKDGSNAEQVDRLIEESAAVREAQLSQLRAKEAEAGEKVRAANDRVVQGLNAERAALTSTERERFVAQALSRLSAEATAQQRREVEELAGALYDEQQALQARQRLMDDGRSVTDPRHGAALARRSVRLPAPVERRACAHGQCASHNAPLDRHRRGRLPDGVASNGLQSQQAVA
jgi:hypothetical protein